MKRTIKIKAKGRYEDVDITMKISTADLTKGESDDRVEKYVDNIFEALLKTCNASTIKIVK